MCVESVARTTGGRESDDDVPAAPSGLPPPPRPRPALGTSGAVALAACTVGGALVGRPLSLLLPLGFVLVAGVIRRPVLLLVAAALAASGLAARAEAGMAPPAAGAVQGQVTLVSDPESRWGGVEAVARHDGRLVLLEADAPAAQVVRPRLAGERLVIEGRIRPLGEEAEWLRVRHVAARLTVSSASPGPPASVPWRAANHLRRTLSNGAQVMGEDRRSLFVGLVLGDDRNQTPELTDDFRGSGLSHLLAVSGQNVAFVLAVAAPVLRRVGPTGRLVAVAALLALFATVTRFEPSVLRAVAMAGAAVVATVWGRPTTGVHLLALAVTGLVLADPFLVRSTGFQLSVAATAGIVVLGPRLVRVLPGPPVLVLPVAVTMSAQLGVAPLLVTVFGGVPVASLPANLVAAPAAALVMTWGLPAGLAAGLLPSVARWVHLPTTVALGWLEGVARRAASVPLGQLGLVHVVALAAALGVALVATRCRSSTPSSASLPPERPDDRPDRRAGWPGWAEGRAARLARPLAVLAAVLAVTALAAPGVALSRPVAYQEPAPGVSVWRAEGAVAVILAPGGGARSTLEGLRLAGITRIDVLVVGPGASAGDQERAARHRAAVVRTEWLGRDPPVALRVGGLGVVTSDASACVVMASRSPCTPPSEDAG